MSSLKDIKLFTTQSHACSYLPGEEARTLFIDPEYEVSTEFHTHLSEIGFRRSGAYMYRPHCSNCQHCVASRVIVERFTLNKRFRRTATATCSLPVAISLNPFWYRLANQPCFIESAQLSAWSP